MQTDRPFPHSPFIDLPVRKNKKISPGYTDGRHPDVGLSVATNNTFARILQQIPVRSREDHEDLNALREWVNAKLDREDRCDKMYLVTHSSPWRVG